MSDSDRVQPLLLVHYLSEISAAIRRGETAGQVTELPGAIPPLCEWHISTELSLDDICSALGMDRSRH
jgi:hypothetical protein